MSERGLQTLVTDLGKRFEITKFEITKEDFDMEYIYANRIEICVEANEGKIMRRTWGKEKLI